MKKMKNILLTLLIIIGVTQTTVAQTEIPCKQKTWVVNVGSIPDYINIYHSGNYLTHPSLALPLLVFLRPLLIF